MRKSLLAVGLALAGCGSGPKFKNPVVVLANDTPIYDHAERGALTIVLADKGDTLEYSSLTTGLAGAEYVAVTPDANYNRFKNGDKYGYILRSKVKILPAVAPKAVTEPAVKVEHLNR